jgi:hypothetical protein
LNAGGAAPSADRSWVQSLGAICLRAKTAAFADKEALFGSKIGVKPLKKGSA